jgi:selenide,water dikinase
VNALTDVTGFGLLGHLWNIAEASQVTAKVRFDDVPLMPGVQQLAEAGVVPGGSRRNLADITPHVRFPEALAEWKKLVLADAQTNGGLLATVRPRQLPSVLKSLRKRGVEAAVVGSVAKGRPEILVE